MFSTLGAFNDLFIFLMLLVFFFFFPQNKTSPFLLALAGNSRELVLH